jgi:hypothetical protein
MEEENPKTTKSTKLKQNVPHKNGMVEWSSTSLVEMRILKQLIWSLLYFAWTVIERGLCPNQQWLKSNVQHNGMEEWSKQQLNKCLQVYSHHKESRNGFIAIKSFTPTTLKKNYMSFLHWNVVWFHGQCWTINKFAFQWLLCNYKMIHLLF